MERINKLNKLKAELKKESEKENPDEKVIKKLRLQIAHLGIGLDLNSFLQKPFTNV